ncbi:type II secretion system F family protein [Pseudobacteriovorax antillogorgiicola]|uniref:General secretion pathway protein F n=1 Tax=Pseudobacteriovorax antillogorgiicola TaxID=1513793 RepID=A0A1Y6B6X2_9BACT|nr:type II secretion system F family protein [Pseudobacteriovorax antillogorgiicola]TCS58715.1 type II secretion system protein F (GspF) [Pseudobacteriovorax antillogorgiicola]SME95451.1 general secretion pathway protein F [Pseudobacteriovorax antillogorgiicola]
MPIYSYKGYDAGTGANRKGKVDAESERAARQHLRQKQKIIVADIKEEGPASSSTKSSGGSASFSLFTPRVSLAELSVMVRQFATLQGAHVPLDESLKALVSQMENPTLRSTLAAVKDSVSEGKSLADSSAAYPGIFNNLYVNMVRAGETSGTLSTVLLRLADFLEYQVTIRGKIMQAMMYPTIMIIASLAIVGFLVVFIVPKLAKVFSNMKVAVPWYTQALMDFSEFMQLYWYTIPAMALVIFFTFRGWKSSEKGARQWDVVQIKAPVVGSVILMVAVSRFTKTLSTLLSSGVPIIQALDITKNVVNNKVLSEVIEQAKIEVQEGNSLASCINRSGVFPGLVTHMIATGEKTGELEQMLAHVAKAYDAEVEQKIAKMITLIEPIMMLFLLVIAVVVIGAMVMPMMDVMKQVR